MYEIMTKGVGTIQGSVFIKVCLLIQGNTANVFYMIMNLENMANMFYANMIFLVFNSKVIILLFSAIVFSSVKE